MQDIKKYFHNAIVLARLDTENCPAALGRDEMGIHLLFITKTR